MSLYQIGRCGKIVVSKSPRCAGNTRGEHREVTPMQPKRTIPCVCRQCGTGFLARPTLAKRGRAMFCGRPCAYLSFRRQTPIVPLADGSVSLPIFRRDGSVRSYVIVDAADAEWVSRWRWHLDSYGYAMRSGPTADGKQPLIYLHREVLGLKHGDPTTGDHINRDKLDNRQANLRAITKPQNGQNVSGFTAGSSRYRGVSWRKDQQRWAAYVTYGGRKHHLGFYTDEQQAAEVARAARLEHLPYSVEQGA
jgi:hypothetical protein